MDACRAGFDHLLHELESVERSAESGFGVGDDGREPVGPVLPSVQDLDLIGAAQGVVDALDDRGDAVGGVETLVGVHLSGEIGVCGDLPAAEVDGLQSGFDLLDRLVAGEGPEGVDIVFGLK